MDDTMDEIEAIYAEIQQYGDRIKTRKPGDIDYQMIQDALDISYWRALKVGQRMVESGEYEKIQIVDRKRTITVFRKIINPN